MLSVIMLTMGYLFFQMCVIWGLYRFYKNPSIVDASWSIGLMVSGLIYLLSMQITLRNIIVSLLLIIWALRLAGYLWFTRLRWGHVDKRYTAISSQWKMNHTFAFFLNFQLQALLIFIISFIFFFVSLSSTNTLSIIDGLAIIVVFAGIAGESIADLQLTNFKTNNPGKVCDSGLWYYSRHPNYFFDWVTWLGFTIFALQSRCGYLSLISLALLYYIFTRITGPITEQGSIKSRGKAYQEYQAKTSMFIPWVRR